jgi:hypothetical protein
MRIGTTPAAAHLEIDNRLGAPDVAAQPRAQLSGPPTGSGPELSSPVS